MLLFRRLLRKHRGSLFRCKYERHVSDAVHKADSILFDWFEHIRALSSESIDPTFDQDYH